MESVCNTVSYRGQLENACCVLLTCPPENRPFPKVQTRHPQNGEIAQTQHYAADGQGDDEGDVWEDAVTDKLVIYKSLFITCG